MAQNPTESPTIVGCLLLGIGEKLEAAGCSVDYERLECDPVGPLEPGYRPAIRFSSPGTTGVIFAFPDHCQAWLTRKGEPGSEYYEGEYENPLLVDDLVQMCSPRGAGHGPL